MRRWITTITALLISFISIGQEPADGVFPLKDGRIHYEKVISVDSVGKADIFKRTKLWAVDNFRSQKSALQAEDKEEGYIIFKTNFDELYSMPPLGGGIIVTKTTWTFYCTIKIIIKDNKCKILVYNFSVDGSASDASILNYRAISEPSLKKAWYSKSHRNKQYEEAKNTYISANKSIIEILSSYEAAINTRNNSDF